MNMNNGIERQKERALKPKQKVFCQYYIIDWDTVNAYKKAYGEDRSEYVCRANASRLLAKDSIKAYIRTLTDDIEKTAGLSKLGIILEHKKIAFSTMDELHDSWVTRKQFETLTAEQKACIAEIQTQVKTIMQDDQPIQVEFVKIKLYDKQKSLEQLARLMGYNRDELERLPMDQLEWLADKIIQNRQI